MSSVAARSICLLFTATPIGVNLLAGDELRTAAELPLDNFDA